MAFDGKMVADRLPFIFELLAQESMSEALRPAINYITKLVIENFPQTYRFSYFIDEVGLILEGAVQSIFLWRHNSSISETFYELERVPANNHSFKKWKSLLVMLIVPYLLSKLDSLYSHLLDENDSLPIPSDGNIVHSGKYYVFTLIPYLIASWKASKFLFQLLYLFRRSSFFSPELFLSGVYLVRKSSDVDKTIPTKYRLLYYATKLLAQYFLPFVLFLLKFLEWWYSGERDDVVNKITSLPHPSPPLFNETSGLDPYVCPLCHMQRRNPTTLSCSGFVFCYVCVHNYVQEYNKCPISQLPANDTQLVRIFMQ